MQKKKESPMSVLELEIKVIPASLACQLNSIWHSVLPKIHYSNVVRNKYYICYAITWKGAILGVAIWSSPVTGNRLKRAEKILELRRLALSKACPYNTASRVLRLMREDIKKRFPEITKLISYQDTSKHAGTIYKADNWKPVKKTKFRDWNTGKRRRNQPQTKGDKIRWEYILREG